MNGTVIGGAAQAAGVMLGSLAELAVAVTAVVLIGTVLAVLLVAVGRRARQGAAAGPDRLTQDGAGAAPPEQAEAAGADEEAAPAKPCRWCGDRECRDSSLCSCADPCGKGYCQAVTAGA